MVKVSLSKKKGLVRGAGKPVLRGSFDCGMAPRRKRNAAVGRTDGPGAGVAPDPAMEKAKALLHEVWEGDLPALIPVLERYAKGMRDTVSFMEVAEAFELVADLMAGSVGASGDTCDATDVAVFIHNEGEVQESVEALLALTSIARRVQNRLKDAKHTAELQETLAQLRTVPRKRAAVKGKKQ